MAKSSLHQTFCDNIRARRIELGLKQKDIADKINVSVSAYSDWETGRKDPSLSTVQRICIALNMSPMDALSELAAHE